VKTWFDEPQKIELEALHTKGFDFLGHFVEQQLRSKNFI
jgi:hypothetical protein